MMTVPREFFPEFRRKPKKFPKPLQDRSKYRPNETSGKGEATRRIRAMARRVANSVWKAEKWRQQQEEAA